MNEVELLHLKHAAETLDDHNYEILAEQIWYAFEANGGQR